MPQNNSNEDLELLKLFERFFSFFRNYGRSILIWTFAGMVIGLILFLASPKQYSSTAVFHSFSFTNSEQLKIVENYGALLKNHEYAVLADNLGCSPDLLKKVNSIEASDIQKTYTPNNQNGFEIEVSVKDNAILDDLLKALVHGLDNGEYIKDKLATRRSNLIQLIDNVRIEINKLDSVKQNIESSINGNLKTGGSYIIDVSSINSQVIALDEKLLGYQEELKFTKGVQVFQKFYPFSTPSQPKLLKLLILGCIAGFGIGYVLALYKNIRLRIKAIRP